VSKSEPAVVTVTVPFSGAVKLYHTVLPMLENLAVKRLARLGSRHDRALVVRVGQRRRVKGAREIVVRGSFRAMFNVRSPGTLSTLPAWIRYVVPELTGN
jgi:hypothetical protein